MPTQNQSKPRTWADYVASDFYRLDCEAIERGDRNTVSQRCYTSPVPGIMYWFDADSPEIIIAEVNPRVVKVPGTAMTAEEIKKTFPLALDIFRYFIIA